MENCHLIQIELSLKGHSFQKYKQSPTPTIFFGKSKFKFSSGYKIYSIDTKLSFNEHIND